MLQVRQIKAARSLLGWEQFELATRSGVAISTIRRLEGLKGPIACHVDTITKIQQAFESAGITFIAGRNVGVYLRASK
jgi:predicted transcriptional regulator